MVWVLIRGGGGETWMLENKKQRELFPKPDKRSFLFDILFLGAVGI